MARRRWVLGLGVVGATLGLAAVAPRLPPADGPGGVDLLPGGPPPPPPPHALRVWSWNAQPGSGRPPRAGHTQSELDAISAALRDNAVDLVMLQGVGRAERHGNGVDPLAHLQAASGLGWAAFVDTRPAGWVPSPLTAAWAAGPSVRTGIAVLSRYPLAEAQRHALPQASTGPALLSRLRAHHALLEVEVDLGAARRLSVFTVQLDHADRPNREAQAEIVAAHLRAAGRPTLLGGDLNAPPPEAPGPDRLTGDSGPRASGERTVPTLRAVPGLRPALDPEAFAAAPDAFATLPQGAPSRRLDELFASASLPVLSARVPQVDPSAAVRRPTEAVFALPAP